MTSTVPSNKKRPVIRRWACALHTTIGRKPGPSDRSMLLLLNLACTALEAEGVSTPDSASNFRTRFSGLFSFDVAAVYYATLHLRQTLTGLFGQGIEGEAAVLVEQILHHGVMDRFKNLLEISAAAPPMSDWAEAIKMEILRTLHLCLRVSAEQKQAIAKSGVHEGLASVLCSHSTEACLLALKCLTLIAEVPSSDATLFEHLLHSVERSLKQSQMALIQQGLRALHTLYFTHRWLPWDRLSQLIPVLKVTLESGDNEAKHLSLIILRELTSGKLFALRPISKSSEVSNENLPSVKNSIAEADSKANRKAINMVKEFPNGKAPVEAARQIVHSRMAQRVISMMESSNEGIAFEAAMIIRNMVRVAPFLAHALHEMGCVEGFFSLVNGLNYYQGGPSCSTVITESISSVLVSIKEFLSACPLAVAALRGKKSPPSQGVSLIMSLSQSSHPEVSPTAIAILKLIFSK